MTTILLLGLAIAFNAVALACGAIWLWRQTAISSTGRVTEHREPLRMHALPPGDDAPLLTSRSET